MKLVHGLPRFVFLISFFVNGYVRAADAPLNPAGYWSGAISLPNQELGISVELISSEPASWQGTIDIPMQGMHGFKLSPVKVNDTAVEFDMPGIPGEPHFAGKLAADAQSLSGDFTQAGNRFPFRLERKPKPVEVAREAVPAQGVPGKGLIGYWRGALVPMPNVELRLALEIEADATGKPGGVLVSLDQGKARIPLDAVTEVGGTVDFATPRVNGKFHGTMNGDGSEIAGEWTQNGRTTALVFKRLAASSP